MNAAPGWLPVITESIPRQLREGKWVLWRAEPREEGKPAKVPYQVAYPSRRASSTDPTTWATFDDVVDAYSVFVGQSADARLGPVAGIGVVLTADLGVTCLDLDRVYVDGQLDPRAAEIIRICDSWTERSPSGTGLHAYILGRVPTALKGEQIEVYSESRYICVTGHQWPGSPSDLRQRQDYLDRLMARAYADRAPRRPWTGKSAAPPDDLVGALIAKLQEWGVEVDRIKKWQDGYLAELVACPWAGSHTTGPGGAAVIIRASGAYDFVCLHAHCGDRDWQSFRTALEVRR